ncbi:hypothetical protein INT48_001805 [Thamnidium elegans]|uniref:Xylanolytic transcriptional activator regulatory domain-containing protein n=1 Tax=Thamnidium elegans TaxID=101142 RepID=A0A8H7VZE1_9FUNG|nr:hypothetical protein INT48_001805 [Thamnidium elegans]
MKHLTGSILRYVDNLEKKCKKMESLLAALTQCTIEDLERNGFQYAGHKRTNSPTIQTDTSSDEEDEIDLENSESEEISDRYDSIKYTGQSSAGLNLFDNELFKSQSTVPWPGREDIVLKLMSDDELMIIQTEKSKSGKPGILLDVGLSMKAPVFDRKSDLTTTTSLKTLKKPARHQLDQIIGVYFSHLHPIIPIINKNKFLSQYHHSPCAQNHILVQAVLAMTFRFASQYLPNQKDAVETSIGYFRKVVKRLRDSTRSKLSHVQAALLIVLYLDMEGGDVESLQWHTLGQAIRMAQDLGLHRSCAGWNLPRSEIETRHRVFYACYVMDRWHGARSGKPLTILDRDFDTEMPSPYEITDDDCNSESGQGLPIYRVFSLFIQLSEILGRVLKSLYAPNSKNSNSNANLDDPTIVAVLNRRLEIWKASLDEPLDGVFLSELNKINFKIYYSAVILLLHRPFSTLSPSEHPHLQQAITESEKLCRNTAKELNEIVTRRQYQTTHPAYYTLFVAPSCFVYALFQSSLVFLSNAIKSKSSSDARVLNRSIDVLKKHGDVGPAARTLEILKMLISINGLDITEEVNAMQQTMSSPTTISPIIPITAKKKGSKIQDLKTNEQAPKSFYFQPRLLHDSIIKPNDLKMSVPNQHSNIQHNYYLHRRQTHHHQQQQQQPIHQQVPLNCYVQNYPAYSNTPVYSHQRSISLDQLNSSQQQMYTHHTRSISHDDLAIMTAATSSFQRNTANASSSKQNDHSGMNVNDMLTHGYSPQMNHNESTVMMPFNQSLSPVPQNYTYDPSMNMPSTSLPPSNLNWSDWDVYIGQQNPSQQEHVTSSPQHIQYS